MQFEDHASLRINRLNYSYHMKWRKPKKGWIKCNVDGSFIDPNTYVHKRVGFSETLTASIEERIKVPERKLKKPLMQNSCARGYKNIEFECNCETVINIMNSRILYFDGYNWVGEVMWWSKKFADVRFLWTRRNGNKVADKLAKQPITQNEVFVITFMYHLL